MNSAPIAKARLGIGTPDRQAIEVMRREQQVVSVEQWSNRRREADYVAKRNGVKAPLLTLWRVQ